MSLSSCCRLKSEEQVTLERERESEKKREKEEMMSMMTKLKEQHDRELTDERSKIQSMFENAARAQAEDSNPFHLLMKVVEAITEILAKAIFGTII